MRLLINSFAYRRHFCVDPKMAATIINPLEGKIYELCILNFLYNLWRVIFIAIGYGLDDRGVGVPVGSRIFFSPRRSDRIWAPTSPLSIGYRGRFSQEYGGSGLKPDNSRPTSWEVKKMWIYISTSPSPLRRIA
jgi:hypothetical protein